MCRTGAVANTERPHRTSAGSSWPSRHIDGSRTLSWPVHRVSAEGSRAERKLRSHGAELRPSCHPRKGVQAVSLPLRGPLVDLTASSDKKASRTAVGVPSTPSATVGNRDWKPRWMWSVRGPPTRAVALWIKKWAMTRTYLVGKAGFEPAASASRTLRAAKLRHFPSAGAGYSSAPPCLVIVAAGARMTTLATLLRSIFEMRRVHPANSS
jgi:hypothetical protein